MSRPKTWPSARVYLNATGPSETPTGTIGRYDLIDVQYRYTDQGKRFVVMAMESTALSAMPPPKHLFIEVEAALLDYKPGCFVDDPPWFHRVMDVFREAGPIEQDGSDERE